jgi:hypothetical protein
MIRDKNETEEYFKNFIEEDKNRINKFMENIKTGSIQENRIPAILRKIYGLRLGITVAKYSAGFNSNEIKKELFETIDGFFEYDNYVQLLWMISMGILLDIDDKYFNKMVNIINKVELQDYLVDYIIAYRKNDRKINNNVLYVKPYKKIMEITKMDKENAEKNLKEYLKKEWYKNHSDAYWYNNHKGKHNTYFGYWSFESAVIVKINKLEHNIFKDIEHFPYDLIKNN